MCHTNRSEHFQHGIVSLPHVFCSCLRPNLKHSEWSWSSLPAQTVKFPIGSEAYRYNDRNYYIITWRWAVLLTSNFHVPLWHFLDDLISQVSDLWILEARNWEALDGKCIWPWLSAFWADHKNKNVCSWISLVFWKCLHKCNKILAHRS